MAHECKPFKRSEIRCRVVHRDCKVLRLEEVVRTDVIYASFDQYIHTFVRAIKRVLIEIPDLTGVKIKINHNGKVTNFILEVARLLALQPQKRWIHIVVYNKNSILYCGTLTV